MKKIMAILINCFLIVTLLVSCGNNIRIDKTTTITNGKIYDLVKSKHRECEIKYLIDPIDKSKGSFEIYLDFKKENPQKISDTYNKICNEVIKEGTKEFNRYEGLDSIQFVVRVNGDNKGPYLTYNRDKDSFKLKNEEGMSKKEDFEEHEEEDSYLDEEPEVNKDKVNVPEKEGEFNIPQKLMENINFGKINLEYSSFKVIKKGEKKIVKVDLLYGGRVLIVGIVTRIRNNIEKSFKDQCDEIDLSITQKHPMDVFECKYIDGTWDKEIK